MEVGDLLIRRRGFKASRKCGRYLCLERAYQTVSNRVHPLPPSSALAPGAEVSQSMGEDGVCKSNVIRQSGQAGQLQPACEPSVGHKASSVSSAVRKACRRPHKECGSSCVPSWNQRLRSCQRSRKTSGPHITLKPDMCCASHTIF